jgi:CrcB protein
VELQRFLIVCAGGAAGSGSRYLVGLWAGKTLGAGFPYGTLFVNLVGCFLIALVMQLAISVEGFPENLRLGLTAGFMGGLTTYSSFNYETTKLMFSGAPATGALNIGVTAIGCFVMGLAGTALARAIT